ncbi:MAG: hypothetical protein GX777_08195 [Fastidiosipila sp.]|nr:hypothetical protein [Fastidiosipila sp.]
MTSLEHLNSVGKSTDCHTSLAYDSLDMREEFRIWLANGNASLHSSSEILSSMDQISEYALNQKITTEAFWEYTHPLAFISIFKKLLGDKKLYSTDRKTYKIFISAGKLYQRFLKDNPFSSKRFEAVSEAKEVESAAVSIPLSQEVIDPENVIAWLITQPNTNGSLYLENVVRQYMRALRSAPAKLELSDGLDDRNVFKYHTVEELTACWDKFKAAPNYKQVNRSTSGMFSAGMSCLLRYLQNLSKPAVENEGINKSDLVQLIENYGLEYKDKRDSGGAIWVIGGRELNNIMINLSNLGFHFKYKRGGGRSSNYRDAWWSKEADLHLAKDNSKNCTDRALDPAVILKLTEVLSARFSNGYRLDSPIERKRLETYFEKDVGIRFLLSDEELERYISVCGITYKGKIYAVSPETLDRIKLLVDDYFSLGSRVIFYEEFYIKNESWLFENSVVSEGMLTDIFREIFPKLLFTQTYFGHSNASIFTVIESEILRVWGEEILLTYEQLAERLIYIPISRIKQILGQNGDFIWNSVGVYSHISQIQISDEEREAIRKVAESSCTARGYVSIADLPFGEIRERNYMLSETAIHNAIYQICLLDKFDKRGKIVTRKGDVIDAQDIINNYCRNIDSCSLDELLDFEKELTGEVHRWMPMEAGNSNMVRVDKDNYVADRFVDFNTDLIDEAIDMFVSDDYLPLKAFTTFSAFPDCGYTWNLFLLESYCRRFSNKYRFDALSVNSRNAGAVIQSNCNMDYIEIMIDAVANADVPLKNIDVGNFLFNKGFTGRRSTAKANEIINKAKIKREKTS